MLSAVQLEILRRLDEMMIDRLKSAWPMGSVLAICRHYDHATGYFDNPTGLEPLRRLLVEPGIVSVSPDGNWVKLTDYGVALRQETEAFQEAWEAEPIIPLDDAEKDQISIKQGETFRGKIFVLQLFKRARDVIRIHDNFCASELLTWLYSTKATSILIMTSARAVKQDPGFESLYRAFRTERRGAEVRVTEDIHDRKIIIDDREAFQVGESIKDIGNKGTTIARLRDPASHVAEFTKLWSEAKPI